MLQSDAHALPFKVIIKACAEVEEQNTGK